jgi:hypothetical protein
MRPPLFLGFVVLVAAACGGSDSSGPSASNLIIESETLVACPTSGRFCCVRTQLVNTSDTTFNVTLRWRAFNAQGVQFADALDSIAGVPPRGRTVSVSAFFGAEVRSCSQISSFERFQFTARAL